MNDSEEKSNVKFYVIGVAVVAFGIFATWAYRTYQRPVRITPKEGHLMAEKFGDEKLDSSTVAPLPGAARSESSDGSQPASGAAGSGIRPTLTKAQFHASTNAWLTGRVVLRGNPPAPKPLPLDPECQADVKRLNVPPPMTRDFEMGTNGGLANVIVTVMNPPGDMPGELLDPITLHIRGCQIQPYVTAVMAGQNVLIKNHDSDFHELKGFPTNVPNPIIDFALLPGAPGPGVTFAQEEHLISVYTDNRRWIKGYISVATHPFFGVTDSNGWFRLPLPPIADAQVRALHPLLPPVTKAVALNAKTNAPVELVLEYQPPKEAAP